jgi:hypothetical protein
VNTVFIMESLNIFSDLGVKIPFSSQFSTFSCDLKPAEMESNEPKVKEEARGRRKGEFRNRIEISGSRC